MIDKKISRNIIFLLKMVILSLLFALLADCSSKTSASSQTKQVAVPVKVAKVVTKDMPVEINTIGNIQPVLNVTVKSQVSGRLLKVNFKEGSYVKKGQLLFTIDSRPFVQAVKEAQATVAQSNASLRVAQANLKNAQAQLGTAKSNVINQQAGVSSAMGNLDSLKAQSDDALSLLKKQQALFAEGIIAERDVEVATTSYKSALAKYQQALAQVNQAQVVAKSASSSGIDQAQAVIQQMQSQIQVAQSQISQNQAAVDNAKIQLSYCQITSPANGKTGNLNITEGNIVNANDSTPIVTINSISPIYATFSVPEKYLTDIQRYSAAGVVRVTAQIDANTTRGGILSSLDNEISQTTGTLELKASFENDDNLLFPGRFVNIVLDITDQPDALVVPTTAVQISQQGQFVYVVAADQTAIMRKITLDRTIGDDAVISDGLNNGETVITDGQLRVSPGATVEIVTDKPDNNTNTQTDQNSANTQNGGKQ